MTGKPLFHVFLAGGGTGGHIFPNIAVAEAVCRLAEQRQMNVRPHFFVSDRPLDAEIMRLSGYDFTALPAQPLRRSPWGMLRFAIGAFQSRQRARVELRRGIFRNECYVDPVLVVTGGFVSGPAMMAAAHMGLRIGLVNLDAVPGKSNRLLASRADRVFDCAAVGTHFENAEKIFIPIRMQARASICAQDARRRLDLDPDRPTLLITAGSQGAMTINRMMRTLVRSPLGQRALYGWQVVHLCGPSMREELVQAYREAEIPAYVASFMDAMGMAWAAASLAISRAGASSVAEAWFNAVPAIFFPYPYHADEHQRLNVEPLTSRGAGVLCKDVIDPVRNVQQLLPLLQGLTQNELRRQRIQQLLHQSQPDDGGVQIARWVLGNE